MNKNYVTGLFAVVLGGIYLMMTLALPHQKMGDPLGPSVFPLLIGGVTVVLGIALLFREKLTRPEKRQTLVVKKTGNLKTLVSRIVLSSVFGIIYGIILDPLGYLLSTFIFMLLLMYVVNKFQRLLESFAVAAGFSLVTYVSFGILLKLSLPRGILYF